MKSEIKNILMQILGEGASSIITDEDTIECGGDGTFYSQFNEKGIPSFIIQSTNNCQVRSGCSRLVLIPKDKDYVIKMPIMIVGTISHDVRVKQEDFWDENELISRKDDSYYYIDNLSDVETLTYSGLEILNTKFTVTRRSKCDLMDEENAFFDDDPILRNILLENVYEGTFNGIPVYTQKKAEVYCDIPYKCTKSKDEKEENSIRSVRGSSLCKAFPDAWIAKCINTFGEEKTTEILSTICDRGIDADMNSANFGYLNNIPVIFDFASYYENEVWDFSKKEV